MAGNRPKKVEQPKTFDQATALFRRASQLKRESEQPKQQASTGSEYGDTLRRNRTREQATAAARKPETQNRAAAAIRKAYQDKNSVNKVAGTALKTQTSTSKTVTRQNSAQPKTESYRERKTREDRERQAQQATRVAEASKRGASGQAFRQKGDKSYMSGAEYKAWKTAQDKARQAKKGK